MKQSTGTMHVSGKTSLYWTFAIHVLLIPSMTSSEFPSAEQVNSMTSVIESFRKCRGVHGLTLAVVSGATTFTRGFGESDAGGHVPVSPNQTLFCVASLTKAFTSTIAAKLLPQSTTRGGYGTSAQPISRVLGNKSDCCRFSDEYRNDHVTMIDLLSHRTGIPRYDFLWYQSDTDLTRKEIVRRVRYAKQVHEFRDRSTYNNVLYTMAGHVMEMVTGESWEDLIRRHLLEPLGMTSTTFYGNQPPPGHWFSKQYETHGGVEYVIPRNLHSGTTLAGPSISLCSTADDMAKWLRFHLNGGKNGQGDRVVREKVFETLHEPIIATDDLYYFRQSDPLFPVRLDFKMYGKGWFIGSYREHKIVMHYGSFPGFYSMMMLVPARGVGIYTSINGAKGGVPHRLLNILHMYLLDIILGDSPWLDANTVCTYPKPWINETSQFHIDHKIETNRTLSRDAELYLGVYEHPVLGRLRVQRRKNTNALFLTIGSVVFDLYQDHGDQLTRVPRKPEWMVGPGAVLFNFTETSGHASKVTMFDLEWRGSPVFERTISGSNTVRSGSCPILISNILKIFYLVFLHSFFKTN